MKILSSFTHHQVITNRNTFVHLRNTNEDIFNQIREIYVPPLTIHATNTLTLQEVLIHMN